MSISVSGNIGSCACYAISGLSYTSTKDPMVNLREFCKTTMGFPAKANKFVGGVTPPAKLCAHYVFTSGPGEYGVAFAKLIEAAGLGKIATLPAVSNPFYGKEHLCQTWVWQPDLVAINKWWSNECETELRKEAQRAERVASELERVKTLPKEELEKLLIKVFSHGAGPDVYGDPKKIGNEKFVGGLLKVKSVYSGVNRFYLTNSNYVEGALKVGGDYMIVRGDAATWWVIDISPKVEPIDPTKGKKRRWRTVVNEAGVRERQYFWMEPDNPVVVEAKVNG